MKLKRFPNVKKDIAGDRLEKNVSQLVTPKVKEKEKVTVKQKDQLENLKERI